MQGLGLRRKVRGREQMQQRAPLFDYLVGVREQLFAYSA